MYSRGKEKQLNKRKVFFYMEPIELPCNNCISLPRCIVRLKEEYWEYDVLPFGPLMLSCSILEDYFPVIYCFDSTGCLPEDIEHPEDSDMSEKEWIRRCDTIMDKFDKYF